MDGSSPLSEDFEYFHSLFRLFTELFVVFGFLSSKPQQNNDEELLQGSSIFTGNISREPLFLNKKLSQYKRRCDFSGDREYGEYMKSILVPGMKVRARVRYETVKEGDIGEFQRTNDGTPPAQFAWDGLQGETYWVHWHQVEIYTDNQNQPSGDGKKDIALLHKHMYIHTSYMQ